METEKNLLSPEFIYSQSKDKQRIVIAGNQARVIAGMIIHVLQASGRSFDYVTRTIVTGMTKLSRISDAPIIVIEESHRPFASAPLYHHHIAVISDIDDKDDVILNLIQFADRTPKAGILIYSEADPAGAIGKKPRADITSFPYAASPHTAENGKLILISGSNERFPVAISGEQNLRSISAAREVLTKLGVTTDQFYRTIASFEG